MLLGEQIIPSRVNWYIFAFFHHFYKEKEIVIAHLLSWKAQLLKNSVYT